VLGVVATHAFFLWSVRERIARGDPDFTVFYTAGKILRAGHGALLYDAPTQLAAQREFADNSDIRRGPLPFIHPPFEAVLLVPFTFFSYTVAFWLWSALNLVLLYFIVILLRRSVPLLKRLTSGELFVICLAFFPIFANFHQGQDAILLLLIVVLAYRALTRQAIFLAGCWLGFGIFKYHLILPLVFILVIWKGSKLFWGFVSVSAALTLLSLAVVGWRGVLQYPALALQVVSSPDFGGIPPRQLPNLMGLLGGWSSLDHISRGLQVTALASALLLLIVVAWLRRASNDLRLFGLCLSCAVIAAALAGYSTNTYDLSLLVLPLALVADYLAKIAKRDRFNIVVPVLPLLISPVWFFLWMKWQHINLIAVFLIWWLFAIRHKIVRTAAEQAQIEPVAS